MESIRKNYEHTIKACYIGYITQAIVNNLAPLLFLRFATEFELTLDKITVITTINFLVQLVVDLISTKYIDRIGYRKSVVFAHVCASAGLILLGVLPRVMTDPYAGILIAVFFYAVGGGIIEVLISPIVEACPTKSKEKAMSLLHSFYCWGHLSVVLLSTLFFSLVGIRHWSILTILWAAVPAVNIFYFLLVPIFPIVGEGVEKVPLRHLLKNKVFWLVVVLMICAGASEQSMSQWASAFAESGLHVSKTVGDLLGPCAFALCMGLARALYGKFGDRIPLKKFMAASALLCIVCYLTAALSGHAVLALAGCAICGFAVGIFWPGTFSMAALAIPGGGTAMYALLALAGDLGCSSGPTLVGLAANASGGNLKAGLILAVAFPVVMLLGILTMKKKKVHNKR